jgi:hypothetical protein
MSEPIITNTNGPQMAVLPSLFGALAVIFLLLRLWARRLKKISLVLNDYLMIVATVWPLPLCLDRASSADQAPAVHDRSRHSLPVL